MKMFKVSMQWWSAADDRFEVWKYAADGGRNYHFFPVIVSTDQNLSNANIIWTEFLFFFTVATKQVFRLRLETNSAPDLNNPDVMEEMLKQVNHVWTF